MSQNPADRTQVEHTLSIPDIERRLEFITYCKQHVDRYDQFLHFVVHSNEEIMRILYSESLLGWICGVDRFLIRIDLVPICVYAVDFITDQPYVAKLDTITPGLTDPSMTMLTSVRQHLRKLRQENRVHFRVCYDDGIVDLPDDFPVGDYRYFEFSFVPFNP